MEDIPEILNHAKKQGSIMSDGFNIRSSTLGGMGIFADSAQAQDAIVLRIPNSCTYDIANLLAWTKSLQSETDRFDGVIKGVLSIGNLDSETAIIRSYMWGLTIIQSISRIERKKMDALDRVEPYLRVLQTTPVVNVKDLDDAPDYQVQMQVLEKRNLRKVYGELAEIISDLEMHLPFEMAFQIHQAVKSRVLEIPHAVGDGDDFETNVTLVPLLDYANHNSAYNAVFDVDRATRDVLLRLETPVEAGQEVFISYSPGKNKNTFFRTYGFMPDGNGVYQWRIPDIDGLINKAQDTVDVNYTALAKWLRVVPQLAIHVDSDNEALLDPLEFQIPILMIPGLQYYADWTSELADIREEMPVGSDLTGWIEKLQQQERSSDIIYAGDTAFGVTWNDTYVNIPNILEQTGYDLDEEYGVLMSRSLHVIKSAISQAMTEDEQYLVTNSNPALHHYFQHKHNYLEQISNLCG